MEITYTLNEIDEVAEKLIAQFDSKTILLNGDMGAGKTTLAKSIVKQLGSKDEVGSPTFSIVNEYTIDDGLLFHFDLYRIHELDEAYDLGIEDYLYSNHWIVLEWPDVIKPILSEGYNEIFIKESFNKDRLIKLIK